MKEAPGVFAEMKAGKHKSVNAAAEKAGVTKKPKKQYAITQTSEGKWILAPGKPNGGDRLERNVFDSKEEAQNEADDRNQQNERYYTCEIEEGKRWSLADTGEGNEGTLSGDTSGEYYDSQAKAQAAADALNIKWMAEKAAKQAQSTPPAQPTPTQPQPKGWNPLEHGYNQIEPGVFYPDGKTTSLSASKTDGNKIEVWTVPPKRKNAAPRVNVTIDGLGLFPGIPLSTQPDHTAGIVSKSAIKKADEAWEKENGDDALWQTLIKNSFEAWLAQWLDSQHEALFSTGILGMVINYAKERDLQGTKEVLEDNLRVVLEELKE